MKDSWVDVGKYAASGCFSKLGIGVIFIAKQKICLLYLVLKLFLEGICKIIF